MTCEAKCPSCGDRAADYTPFGRAVCMMDDCDLDDARPLWARAVIALRRVKMWADLERAERRERSGGLTGEPIRRAP